MATHSSTLAQKIPWTEEPGVHGVAKSQARLSDFTSLNLTHAKQMGETVETVADFIFLGSKITADGDHSHEIKRHSLEGKL